ncbi:hypothetical protein F5Y13DRAFT_186259 [Hypoxylon sp. FL1857]|nr:hypothetical protein F5Y13DRAFT_186259 [Hypoxylon sp. FL1857]
MPSPTRLPSYNPYWVLKVNDDAELRDIKAKHRQLSQRYLSSGERENYARVQEAYRILSNDEARTWYDEMTKGPTSTGIQFKSKPWAMEVIGRAYRDLKLINSEFYDMCSRINNRTSMNDSLGPHLDDISDTIRSNYSTTMEVGRQANTIAEDQWQDQPQVQNILTVVDRLREDVSDMITNLKTLNDTAVLLESASDEEERQRLTHLFSAQASQWNSNNKDNKRTRR